MTRLLFLLAILNWSARAQLFRAGAAIADITPTNFPVIVNAMFTERSADKAADPLNTRALVLDDGTNRVALAVVDTCMMPRDLIDHAKSIVTQQTKIPANQILISATHTHSAPSAMGCLGSRADSNYVAFLPGRIAAAIVSANARLAPAKIGWIVTNAWHHTFNRRWIRRPDKLLTDPFGLQNVRAHMHPGHQSPDAIGPSGPVDPGLSIIAVQTPDNKPIALFANYSQHYYDSPLLSSDYYGRFALHISKMLNADENFVGIMSQGTSGDLMWMDYGSPRKEIGYDAYAREIAEIVHAAASRIEFKKWVPIKMAEGLLPLAYRVPSPERLDWARNVANSFENRQPQTLPEIYALEAIHLHQKQKTELVLQAIRIGDLGIAALPNEVFALTGLKLKKQSPLPMTFNVELANGAEGYIPPVEQHKLGGYTTWPARTAGLETGAEEKIVAKLLTLLEEVSGQKRKPADAAPGLYAKKIAEAKPLAYWRLDQMNFDPNLFEDGVAFYLPGVGSGDGPDLKLSNFSAGEFNRAAHFAGGRMRAKFAGIKTYSVEFWFWNGLPNDARAVTGYMFSRGPLGDREATGDHLGIGGTHDPGATGKLILFNGNKANQLLSGRTTIQPKKWHHVVFIREGKNVTVYLDGREEISGQLNITSDSENFFWGGRNDNFSNFEGKLDEIAFYDRTLAAAEVREHFAISGMPAPPVVQKPKTTSPALSPMESLRKIHVTPGYKVELAASEPLTLDPVAIDWDAKGRLWIVEMADYPLGLDNKGAPGGRIRVLEDLNGDWRYDKSQLFADGLNFPTGLITWRDGVIVTAAPEILFLRDTDGDGRADKKEVLFSGFLEGNQQLRINGLRWGLDNWIYCAVGGHYRGYGAATKIKSHRTGEEILLGSRDFRFRPDTGEFDPQSGPAQFGRNRDDWGHWFGTQNSQPLWHYVLQDHYLRRNPHVPSPDPIQQVMRPLNPKIYPASPQEKRFHSYEQAGHFTSGCSGAIYRDALLFPASEMHGFACEPFHNVVHHEILRDDSVSFIGERTPEEQSSEFFASEDRWCRPVMVRTGPDGALWVVDMYRYMIEHPDWLPAEGRDELLPHYREGEDKGRIYRVLPKNASSRSIAGLDNIGIERQVAALDSSNEWQRDKAHQLLFWKQDSSSIEPLIQLARSTTNALAQLHALCVLDGLGALPPELVEQALKSQHAGLRENALRLAEKHPTQNVIAAAAKLVSDRSEKVRLQLASALGEWKTPEAGETLATLASKNSHPYIVAAVMSSALPHLDKLVAMLADNPAYAEPLQTLALALNRSDLIAELLKPIFDNNQFARYSAFLQIVNRRNATLANLLSPPLLEREKQLYLAAAKAIEGTGDSFDALALIARQPGFQEKAGSKLAAYLQPKTPAERQRLAINILAETTGDRLPALLTANWQTHSPEIRSSILEALLRRENWSFDLLQRIDSKEIPAADIDAARRARLNKHGSERIRALATRVFAQSASSRSQVLDQFRPALQLTGQPARGKEVYARLCITCHKRDGKGNEVGPDLLSVIGHAPEKLLTNILDPNIDIQPGYHSYTCATVNGEELQGLISSETANSVIFKFADGTTRAISRAEIKSLKTGNLSLMPEGLESGLTHQDAADLIAFLRANPTTTP